MSDFKTNEYATLLGGRGFEPEEDNPMIGFRGAARALPYFRSHIIPPLQRGEHVLVSAHGNSLRAIIMQLEQMSTEQILTYELKTGAPHIYELDEQMLILEKHIPN